MYKTNNEKKDRLKWIDARLETLNNKPIIQAYKKWKTLPDENRIRITNQWNAYYERCKVSPQAITYRKMREALKQDDMSLLHRLLQEARALGTNEPKIPQPTSVDPNLFWTDDFCKDYDRINEELLSLRRVTRLNSEEIFG